MSFLKDQLTDEKGGKYSSKKFWGFIVMLLVCLAFIVDGVEFYTANENLFNSMLIAGCSLLGLRAISGMFKKKDDTK